MTEKKNLKRRSAAVALAVVGVAGLSMAAAAQINLTYSGTFQAGAVAEINGDCQTANVAVSYQAPVFDGAATTPWKVAKVNFAGIDSACQGKKYEAAYKLDGGDWQKLTGGTVAAATTVTVDLPGSVNANDIKSVALTIYG